MLVQKHCSAVQQTAMRADSSRPGNLEKNAMSQNENTGTTDLKNQLTTLNERILQAEQE